MYMYLAKYKYITEPSCQTTALRDEQEVQDYSTWAIYPMYLTVK